jgi:GNAT superfamily N-acetyltransferase
VARRVERAHALQLERTRAARGTGMPAVEVAGGLAVSHGARSPFSAAIGVGLGAPIAEGDVDRIEAHLGPGGGPVRIEVTPFTDPSLTEELGRRGYQLERFFQVWTRPPSDDPTAADVRIAAPSEEGAWLDLFSRAFLGAPIRSESQREGLRCMARAEGSVPWLAFENGIPVGVALSSAEGGVAYLSGAGVLLPSRGRGHQAALVRARLAWAASRGCDLAASATEPGTASQRTLERCGFRVAYPKAVLVH